MRVITPTRPPVQNDVWFRKASPISNADLTLVCLPHAGGGASVFRDWRKHLPHYVEVLAVQYPGHEGRWREALHSEVSGIAGPLATAIAARCSPNLVLYGHSLGAFIAFEVARILRRRGGLQPQHLFVSGSRAPDAATYQEPIHGAPDDILLERLRELGGIPEEVLAHSQLMEVLMPVLRCDLKMDETYRYQSEPPLDCPITAFVGAHDAELSEEQADAWRRHTRLSFDLHVLPGGHWWPATSEAEILHLITAVSHEIVVKNLA